jgi:hypothetical protein
MWKKLITLGPLAAELPAGIAFSKISLHKKLFIHNHDNITIQFLLPFPAQITRRLPFDKLFFIPIGTFHPALHNSSSSLVLIS